MNELAKNICSAGVVGAGGAGFPTHVKAQCRADMVIANGAECEPLLGNDKLLLKTRTKEILQGLSVMASATGARRRIIAIKEKYTDVIDRLHKAAPQHGVEIFLLHNYYPAGDEHEIVNYVTQKIVPEMGIPSHIGIVTNNIETLLNVAQSQNGLPVVQRSVSVIGEVQAPAVYQVPIGTSLRTLLDHAGGVTCESPAFILGGVMMGRLVDDQNTPISKTTGAVFVLPASHSLVSAYRQSYTVSLMKAKSACTQCTLCTEACSRNLLGHRLFPHKIMLLPDLALDQDSFLNRSALLCSDCGCCEYACPMGLSPRKVIRVIKSTLRARKLTFTPAGFEPQVHPLREQRHIPVERVVQRLGLHKYSSTELALSPKKIEPEVVEIMLRQHIGASAKPVVKQGKVRKGDVIARIPRGQLGAHIHASIDGRVVHVTEEMVRICAH